MGVAAMRSPYPGLFAALCGFVVVIVAFEMQEAGDSKSWVSSLRSAITMDLNFEEVRGRGGDPSCARVRSVSSTKDGFYCTIILLHAPWRSSVLRISRAPCC
jgi:hypothetical protein